MIYLSPDEVEEAPGSKKSVLIRKGNGQPISKQTGRAYLERAGGDKAAAHSMAQKDGWKVPMDETPDQKADEPEATAKPRRPQTPHPHFPPSSHAFSPNAWIKAYPKGNLRNAIAAAREAGYEVTK